MNVSKNTKKSAMAAGIIGNSIFGFSFLASKIALRYADPTMLLVVRFGTSLILLTILAAVGIWKMNFRGKNILPLVVLGLCQPVFYFLFENYGIMYTTSAFSGIMIGLVPVAASLLAVVMLKEKFPVRSVWGVLACIVGVVIISMSERGDGSVTLKGFLFLCGAVFTAALYNVLSKQFSEEFSAFERTYVMFVVGFVAFLGISLVKHRGDFLPEMTGLLGKPDFLMAVCYLAVLSSVIAFFCLNYAVSYLTVQQATSYTNLTPVVSVAAGVLILGESFSLMHLVGIVFIMVGIWVVNR